MKYDVAVVADLCLDFLITGKVKPKYGQAEKLVDDYTLELGGSAAIFASQFSKLGGRVGLIGAIGQDLFGHFLIEKLNQNNISEENIIIKPDVKTSVGLGLSYYEDRAMLTYLGAMAELNAEDIFKSGVLANTGHLHIAGYFLLNQLYDFWPKILKDSDNKNFTTSLDTNWSPDDDWDKVKKLLPYIDVFLPNEQEALHISAKDNIVEAGKFLAGITKIVVIKRGEKGAMVFQGNSIKDVGVPNKLKQNLKIADTTGAGDNFDAGFIREWLLKKPLENCILQAISCGTQSLTKTGGIEGQLRKNP